MTQQDLARALGLTVDGLDRLERGVARLAGLALVAAGRRLRVNPGFFFNGLKGFDSVRTIAGVDWVEPRASCMNDNGAEGSKPRPRRGLVIVSNEAPREICSLVE